MNKQKSSNNRRYSNASNNNGARKFGSSSGQGGQSSNSKSYKSGYKKRNSGSNRSRNQRSHWKGRNRRSKRVKIAHSMYISKAQNTNGLPAHVPENNFYDFDLHKVLAKNLQDRKYINPTKIQDQAIPEILKGKDVLGIASTGSGKTGAFLIPMINKALSDKNGRTLVITPTRELASQINNEFKKFAKDTNLRMVLVMGGANIRGQIHLLSAKPQFVVATPGRLMDIENRGNINLRTFNSVVLDEVDQMLDMGFVDDIKKIIAKLALQRQSLFFSATMSAKEEAIAQSILNTPVKVESNKQSPLKSIDQDIVKVRSREHKIQVLHDLLKRKDFNKVLVFSATKIGADKISYELRKNRIRADSLHGDKSQNKRSRVLAKFRQDKIDVLIATDVAARGIDIPNISHVINFDEPSNYNDYIHRIGRTGRIGKSGVALTFVLGK